MDIRVFFFFRMHPEREGYFDGKREFLNLSNTLKRRIFHLLHNDNQSVKNSTYETFLSFGGRFEMTQRLPKCRFKMDLKGFWRIALTNLLHLTLFLRNLSERKIGNFFPKIFFENFMKNFFWGKFLKNYFSLFEKFLFQNNTLFRFLTQSF